MTMKLCDLLAPIPEAEIPVDPEVAAAIDESVRWLGSDAAEQSLARNIYWPKWDSPWWRMLLLFEIGEARRIPERIARAMVDGLDALPLKTFPFRLEDVPPGIDPHLDTSCHCALGSIHQVLEACGVDVDAALPWAKPWFVRYQMADGGLSCEGEHYLVPDACPSSMVGTIAPLEAMLTGDPTAWTPDHVAFVDRALDFLVGRALHRGSSTDANAEERGSEPLWLQPCFPRFYLYDVIRGTSALVRGAELRGTAIPEAAVLPVVAHLAARFPDGVVRLERRATEGIGTRLPDGSGRWTRGPATRFPLLEVTSVVGSASPWVTRQWAETRRGLSRLLAAGQIVGRT